MPRTPGILPKPDWLKIQLTTNKNYTSIKKLIQDKNLHTVCEEAGCPNIYECWSKHKTATFLILGETCTRNCRFCAVGSGRPGEPDREEAGRIAQSVAELGLEHAVITMVNRDDLEDGGAGILSDTVRAVKSVAGCTVEVLSSDLAGKRQSINTLARSGADVLGHNVETVRRLTSAIRSGADYDRSLDFLRTLKELNPSSVTKSGIMLGMGEVLQEIMETLRDLRSVEVDIVNLGQYLRPSMDHLPVNKYWHPDEFEIFKKEALGMGFSYCESGPLVRSSYHAGSQFTGYLRDRYTQ